MIIKNFISVIDPNLKQIKPLTIFKWGLYLIEIFASSRIFGAIYDKLRFRIGEKTYCFAYGNVSRCNFGIQMSFLGLIITIYLLTLSFFSKYLLINIPPIMKSNEIDLVAFKIGIWIITKTILDDWFQKKFEKKYTRSSHHEDRLNRIQRMDKMIGKDVRNVRNMFWYSFCALIICFILLIFEKLEKKNCKKEEKQN
jgi:hypothetical protein